MNILCEAFSMSNLSFRLEIKAAHGCLNGQSKFSFLFFLLLIFLDSTIACLDVPTLKIGGSSPRCKFSRSCNHLARKIDNDK